MRPKSDPVGPRFFDRGFAGFSRRFGAKTAQFSTKIATFHVFSLKTHVFSRKSLSSRRKHLVVSRAKDARCLIYAHTRGCDVRENAFFRKKTAKKRVFVKIGAFLHRFRACARSKSFDAKAKLRSDPLWALASTKTSPFSLFFANTMC